MAWLGLLRGRFAAELARRRGWSWSRAMSSTATSVCIRGSRNGGGRAQLRGWWPTCPMRSRDRSSAACPAARWPAPPCCCSARSPRRLAARRGVDDDGWSPLAVRLALAFHARVGRRLPPQVFWPRPQVDSAFLHLEPRAAAPDAAADRRLAEVLRAGFGQRRKRLLTRLRASHPDWAAALAAAGVGADDRPGALPPEVWRTALQALS